MSEKTQSKPEKTVRVDPKTNLPIGELGARFKKAVAEGLEAARQADKPAPIAPSEPPPEAKPAPAETKTAPPEPKTEQKAPEKGADELKKLLDLKNAPQIPETPKVPDEILAPKAAKGDRTGKTEVAKLNFEQLESAKKELEKKNFESQRKIDELTSQIESWRKGETPEITTMRADLEKYQELVSRYYLEHDPRFQAAFDSKIEQAVNDAKEIVGTEKAAQVEQVLRMPDGETKQALLKEMASEMEDFEAIGLRRAYDDIRKLNRERQSELAKSKENVQKIKEFESLSKAEEAKRLASERQTHAEATLLEAAQSMPEFKVTPGQESQVAENMTNVRLLMANPLTPKEQAQLAVWAVRGYRSAEREAAQVAMIQKLQAAIEALQGAQPGLESSGETKPPVEAPSVESMAGRFRKFMAGQR